MVIGCQIKTHAEWKLVTEKEASSMALKGKDFFRSFKYTLLNLIEYHTKGDK